VPSSTVEEKKFTQLSIDLMDICRLDTPLVKRVPNSQRSAFATAWGQLLQRALDDGEYASWVEYSVLPKLILVSPARGGRSMAKKAKFVDVVRKRLAQWKDGGKEELWKTVVERSKKQASEPVVKKPDAKQLEAAVVSALRMGDVRKALQLLNSNPIAPKTAATLQRLRDLHPAGPPPSAVPFTKHLILRMTLCVPPLALSGLGLLLGCLDINLFCYSRRSVQKVSVSGIN